MAKHYKNKEEKKEMKGEGSFANLPQEVQIKTYPNPYKSLDTNYHDTMEAVDGDLSDSFRKAAQYPSDSMY